MFTDLLVFTNSLTDSQWFGVSIGLAAAFMFVAIDKRP